MGDDNRDYPIIAPQSQCECDASDLRRFKIHRIADHIFAWTRQLMEKYEALDNVGKEAVNKEDDVDDLMNEYKKLERQLNNVFGIEKHKFKLIFVDDDRL